MSEILMFTAPYKHGAKKRMWKLIEETDCHKWVWGIEKGKGGYKHIQARMRISDEGFKAVKRWFPEAHVEKASDTWEYEKKEGHYVTSLDMDNPTRETLKVRYGKYLDWQKTIVEALRTQNVRQIDVILDERGNLGKSWLVGHLVETSRAYYIPPNLSTMEKVTMSVASYYLENGWRDIVVIDIPRGYKWSPQLCIAIEQIKDGIVVDPRYSMRSCNIRGVKVLVCTNNKPPIDKLSADRWRVHNR